jgi:peptidyl-prolyl cis-trans isomerase C
LPKSPRVRSALPFAVVPLALLAAARVADVSAAGDSRRERVVAHGASVAITVGDVEDRLNALPSYQRATFGLTPAAAARRFVDDVMIPNALLFDKARSSSFASKPPAAYAIERSLSGAMVRAVRTAVGDGAAISMDEVSAYFDAHRDRFASHGRVQVWRILCDTKEQADQVLRAAQSTPTPVAFAALAREHSVDKGTYLRGGDLGFVAEDGSTGDPGLRVDANVVRAAAKVADGELVAAPVSEGPYFAVIWRRGSRPSKSSSAAEAAPRIRDALVKQRVKDKTAELVTRLRAERLKHFDDSPLEGLDLTVFP